MKNRAESLREITGRTFDLCIIGAGATGAGCALDAQLRGLSTVLIDAGDFASATSSASTKLVHGGVRYLQQAVQQLDLGQIRVIRRALQERIRMLRNAPHLAHPCEFVVPCFSRFDTLYYALGMKIYDWVASDATLIPTRILPRATTLERLPELNPDHLVGSVVYSDGQFDDARYGVTLAQTFAQAGGWVVNHLKLIAFERDGAGKLTGAVVEDRLGHEGHILRARVFVNATGPFSDTIRALAIPRVSPRLVLSRGVHILLPLALPDAQAALLIPKTEDGRVIFAIPWLGRLLVGTTDQEVTLDDHGDVAQAEAEYLLRHVNRYLVHPRRLDEIVSAFAGIRPLVRTAHAKQTRKLIRDHEVELDSASGLLSVLGGKWTTYRAMAEDAVNLAQQALGQPVSPSLTAQHSLAGAQGYTPEYWKALAETHGLSEPLARHLAEKFGVLAEDVLRLAEDDPRLRQPVISDAPPIRAEIAYAIRHEMAMTIEDVLARRLGLQYFSWNFALRAAPVVADYLADEFSWSEQEKKSSLRDYVTKISRMLAALGLAAPAAA